MAALPSTPTADRHRVHARCPGHRGRRISLIASADSAAGAGPRLATQADPLADPPADSRAASPQRAEIDPYGGVYPGLGWSNGDIDSGFDGKSFLAGGDIVVLLPEFERGRGFVVEFLGRGGAGGLDLSYSRVTQDVKWQGAPGEAVFNAADMNLRAFLPARLPLQIYGSAGFGFKWLVVRDGAARNDKVIDAKFTDLGWNLGAGVLLFPRRRLAVECGASWQSIHYTAVTPIGGDWATIEGEVGGGVTALRAGVLYNFRTPEP